MSNISPKLRLNRRNLLKGTGAMFAGVTFASRFALAEEEKKLSLYNYDTYIGETTLAERRRIKQQTIQNRRLNHQRQAA